MEQKTPFKELSSKAKLQYIWDYYKLPIFGVIIAIAVLVSIIHHYATYKDPILTLSFINPSTAFDQEKITRSLDPYMEENGYDTKKQEAAVENALYLDFSNQASVSQDLMTLDVKVAASAIDAIFTDPDTFQELSDRSLFVDVTSYLDSDMLETYKDAIVYAVDPDTGETYAAGIHLTSDTNAWLSNTGTYDECVVGFCNVPDHTDSQQAFVRFLLK